MLREAIRLHRDGLARLSATVR